MSSETDRKQNPGDMSKVSKSRWHGKERGMSVDMAMAYLDFVPERHNIWTLRQIGSPPPWTEDPILRRRKFTNVYRVLDYGSQFLVKELLYGDEDLTPVDVLARCFLYRMTNRPDIWQATKAELGRYPLARDMNDTLATMWAGWRDAGGQVFSGAYVIMPEPGVKGVDKTRSVVKLAQNMVNAGGWGLFMNSDMRVRYEILRAFPAVGDFIAMQVLTDFGYSQYGNTQDENDFVMPGPGCRNGAREIWPDMDAEWVIKWCRDAVYDLPDCPSLYGRPPSLMDIQNTLCEFSKYARFMRKPQTAGDKPYAVQHTPEPPFLPPHWG